MSGPAASVVVTSGGDADPSPLLGSLARLGDDVEVVLVDTSPDAAAPPATGPGVRVVEPPADHDGSLAAARNLGAAEASADVLVFLDGGCLVDDGAVLDDVEYARRFPRAVLAGPVRHLPGDRADRDGGDDHSLAELSEDLRSGLTRRLRVARCDEYDLFWSARFACSRATFDRIGGFDEHLDHGAEDTDFARRARGRGVALVWHPGAPAYHRVPPPTGDGSGTPGDSPGGVNARAQLRSVAGGAVPSPGA